MAVQKPAFRLWKEASKKGIPFYKQAQAVDIAPSTFSEILTRRIIPKPDEIERLVAYYGVPASELLPDIYDISQKIHGEN